MRERPHLHRAKVAQCMFGLRDRLKGKPHRKLTALDVNRQAFNEALEHGAKCNHKVGDHQSIEGKICVFQTWCNRSALAGAWPQQFCEHILKCAPSRRARFSDAL